MIKKLLFLLWTVFWVLLLLVAILELGVRTGLIRHSFKMWEIVFQLDKQTLYRIKPFSTPDIGPYGNRLNHPPTDSKPARCVLVMGDSFAYGINVKPGETISASLEKLLGPDYETINLGVFGYGPDQSLAQLQSFALHLEPEAVVLTLFPANDFNDLYLNKLFTVDGSGRLRRNPRNRLETQMPRFQSALIWDLAFYRWAKQPSRYIGIYDSFFHDNYDFGLIQEPHSAATQEKKTVMRGVLREFRDTLAARGICFLVVVIPSFEAIVDPGYFGTEGVPADQRFVNEDTAAAICREENIRVINLYPDLMKTPERASWYDAADHHLNVAGYAKVAEAVYKVLIDSQEPGHGAPDQ
ncbi:MAG: hypothetical protein KJ964_11175 [Verrucomicrobia bacterium]|nr:hypothetical protein [Verrucomicrobiota bacterium]MBU1735875.1 hypothetical protein [Verrucomicrobiota bacterium]MBU1855938.1 hypothetical protein [Verrucomicrobiota bacterium]